MSKALISGKVLAIQLGRDQTQIALVGAGSDVLRSVSVPTPQGAVEDGMIKNQEAVRKMLKSILSEQPDFKKTRKVVFCLSTSQVITETVTVPELPAQKMEKLLQSNADMYFPVDMKDYKMIWQVIGSKNKESSLPEQSVQLWAVPVSMVSKYYAVANGCGLSVEAIDFCGNSIVKAVGASFAAPTKGKAKKKLSLNMELSFGKKKAVEPAAEPVENGENENPDTDIYVSLDSDLLGMTFVQNGQVVMQRFTRCGSDPASQVDELVMMLEYFRSLEMGRNSKIFVNVLGALSRDQGLLEALRDALGIWVAPVFSDRDPRWVLCAAAARTERDFGIPTLNRAAAARKQVGAELWQYVLVLAGGAVLVSVILLTLSSRLIWNAEIRGLETTQQALTIQAQQTAGYADNYKNYSALYDNYSADWDTLFGSLRTYNDNLVLALEELEEIMPEKTSVTQLQIAPDGLTVTFASDNKEEVAYLIMALRKLQYSQPTAFSNLQGGGKGPAKTYGPGSNVEDAPTEGDAKAGEGGQSSITALLGKELNQDELMALALTMTPEQFDLLEKAYGKQPETKYGTIAQIKGDTSVSISYAQRSAAIDEMFSTNPFAVNHFVDALEADLDRDEPLLYWHVLEELLIMDDEGRLPSGGLSSAEDLQAYSDVLVEILTKSEANLDASEALFATDPYLEKTYVHYLEVKTSIREEEPLPFLNMDNVLKDLMNGSFNTGDPTLDSKLNALISDDAWAMMEQMNSEEKLEELLSKYLETGTTGNPAMDALINEYLTTGTTGSPEMDAIIKNKLGDQYLADQLGEMMEAYLSTGTTGNAALDELIAAYLTTGTTGNPQMDQIIRNYLGEGTLNDQMADLIDKYLEEGTTDNTVLDNMIKKFLTTGTTGNIQLDNMIQGYIASGEMEDAMGELIENYLSRGTTGNTVMDTLIQKYFNTGTTGNNMLDNMIINYINSGALDNELANLIQKYFNDGTTGVDALDALIEKYLTTGTTGSTQLDKVINNYINSGYLDAKIGELLKRYLSTGTTGSPVLDGLIKNYITKGTTGNLQLDNLIKNYLSGSGLFGDNGLGGTGGTGGMGGVVGGGGRDTRVYLTVVLSYKPELVQAELVRKGLDYSQKVMKVEVAE